MPGSTPRGYPYPLGTEPADGAPQIESLARAIDTDNTATLNTAVRRFASAAARDSGIPSPADGQMCYLTDIKQLQVRIGSSWLPAGGTMPHISIGYPASSIAGGSLLPVTGTPNIFKQQGATFTVNGSTGALTLPFAGLWSLAMAVKATITAGNFITIALPGGRFQALWQTTGQAQWLAINGILDASGVIQIAVQSSGATIAVAEATLNATYISAR